ncbi:protein CYPRO4 [Artemisia annua]|uniref:Protein CYPRO4 n=1 Tax=Artemisia annua TaxID=35608 RepID=A0A2U1L9Q7_ARTAN|nr:protein CYPRO4 [Artemisia annua]
MMQVIDRRKQERHLVAIVGRFSVIWDFHQVKTSAHECYRNQHGGGVLGMGPIGVH